ncbi:MULTISPECIES: magnesium transporter MgtE N-terminal domain-containing protein [Dermacoccus]|uniref:Magnesium transporter n=1 Tax=Dermacoccus nishinomiyaensis TaxID=1274 RepID=A0A075JEW8_9MICO|nr:MULTISPECIES: CBS domain-containing protein [Dermacoccus]MBO1758701.1 magnesium transporter [Dermacoccus sp. NHGro5]AIF40320.1 magnesium transporter [Dermacoccus nishinomiyaensis]EFP56740.1 MgtE intracellular domain protein [Dermacoccus sp. Ellin185]MCG7430300.1 CBS domain-containing protein [Dermacoccus nishinomiyaensis]MCI0154282.1 CBS domain-containing protein [Dermacoccus nishinomiyaensis]
MSTRVFVARLVGLTVFDPLGDRVGRVRDVVVVFGKNPSPRVIGLVVEVVQRRRVFLPLTRVTSIDAGKVITTGLVNMRRFEQRHNETLVCAELFDRQVTVREPDGETFTGTVEDMAMEQNQRRDWDMTKVFVRAQEQSSGASRAMHRLTRRRTGSTSLHDIRDVYGLNRQHTEQSAERLLETYDDLRVEDLAEVIHDLTPKRRAEVARALDDGTLADLLEELPEDDQVEIIAALDTERAADVLEAMEPDDAADLLGDLPPETAEDLLQRMEPADAAPLRRLLTYDENTAGGLMTTEPAILGPEATIAEALAVVRREEVAPALASAVFVVRPPLEVPTGRFLGMVHTQRLLREPPHTSLGNVVDSTVDPVNVDAPLGEVTRTLAQYNLVSLPVVDDDGRLLGAVTVDDVLDHILPEDWREERHDFRQDKTFPGVTQ